MSITTSARFNMDTLLAALPVGTSVSVAGDPLQATAKTLTFTGCTDAQGQTAVTTASGSFVDRDANKATLQTQATNALVTNRTFLALATPSSTMTLAQQQQLWNQQRATTQQCQALIRLLLNQFDATN